MTIEIAGKPIVIIRDRDGTLRAFYNVCRHRAHKLLTGEGKAARIMCPYHAWTYKLDGQLAGAPHTQHLQNFDPKAIWLEPVQVEEFCGFIYVNLDAKSETLGKLSAIRKVGIGRPMSVADQRSPADCPHQIELEERFLAVYHARFRKDFYARRHEDIQGNHVASIPAIWRRRTAAEFSL